MNKGMVRPSHMGEMTLREKKGDPTLESEKKTSISLDASPKSKEQDSCSDQEKKGVDGKHLFPLEVHFGPRPLQKPYTSPITFPGSCRFPRLEKGQKKKD